MSARMRVFVALRDDLAVGERRIIQAEGKSIGVFNTGSQIVAVLNICPHAFAPVCLGKLGGTTLPSKPGEFIWGRENEILRCPWHGWEYDLHSGECLTDKRKLKHFPVVIEDAAIYIEL